nr:putative disease resistance RPP13-like protein 1 [Populus alba]
MMALALIGESLLSAIIEVLVDRIASSEVKDFFKRQKLDDGQLRKLKSIVRAVGKLLNDAEEKHITDPAVKGWLDDLKDALYQADDFLDEIAYKALQLKFEAEPQSETFSDQVRSFLTSLVPCKKGMGEMQPELEKILQILQDLLQQKDSLHLTESVGRIPLLPSQKIPTTALVDESHVFGRKDDRENIMALLLPDDAEERQLDVVPIVGMGGVGKTTLAQLVYRKIELLEDRNGTKLFDLKAWVYVSEEFNILKVTRDILKQVGLPKCDNMTENQIHCELEKKLRGNRVLVVLDDVWSEDQAAWDFLLKPFMSVRKGSKILVTTRSENVASVKSTFPSHRLQSLSNDECWLVLKKVAFDGGNFSAYTGLEEFGREIAKKCSGLPLAAKTLGGLLRSKRKGEEWRNILESNLWNSPNDKVLSALQLSYHCLPSYLKQCFSYCAIFPEGYEFNKKDVILLWMAEGFLVQPGGNKEMEEIGAEFFDDLVSRSFLQQSSRDPSLFIMHDLMNHLAAFTSGEFCFRLEGNGSSNTSRRTRHLSCIVKEHDISQMFEAVCNPRLLRTLILSKDKSISAEVICKLLPMLERLRVLSMPPCILEPLPFLDSIAKLKHLRYLKLSRTDLTKLPESICGLYNLQTLILTWCFRLYKLPAGMGRLINLRHLDITGTRLLEMPPQMGKLAKLRTLTSFSLGNQSGSSIKELGKLQHLCGELCIRNLQNVVDAQDASKADLKGKADLESLELLWEDETNNSLHERVLDQLQPHVNLKILRLEGYGGTRFPVWIGGSNPPSNLRELDLHRCLNLESFPERMHSLLPSLIRLSLSNCPELQSFQIRGLELKAFSVTNCKQLIRNRKQWDMRSLNSLSSFTIAMCDEVESFPEEMLLPSSLTTLEIRRLSNLKSLDHKGLQHLTSLRELQIWHCPNLQTLPEEGLPSSLSHLFIFKCNLLKERCKRPNGEDWLKVSHIPYLYIS